MKQSVNLKINKRLQQLENWREKEIVQALLALKPNGAYLYNLTEIEKHYDVSYRQIKKIIENYNINR